MQPMSLPMEQPVIGELPYDVTATCKIRGVNVFVFLVAGII